MAYNTYYTTTITTLEGNSLVYSLEQDAASTTPNFLNITDKSYKLRYFFNDDNTIGIGLGYLSQTIKLQFYGSDEVDDIKVNPKDWRLKITLDGDVIFIGFPNVKSINEYIIPSFTELYECTFSNVFARLSNESISAIHDAVTNASNNVTLATNFCPIPDFIAKFIVEDYTGETNLVWISHRVVSENCLSSITNQTFRPDPQLRFFSIGVPDDFTNLQNYTVGVKLAELAKAFYMRFGWSYTQGKTIIAEVTAGANGTYTGYDCTYTTTIPPTHRTITTSSNITLQSLSTTDFITEGKDVNSENPFFPKRISSSLINVSDKIVENPNTTVSFLFDGNIELPIDFRDDTVSAESNQGISVYGRSGTPRVDSQVPIANVMPSSSQISTLYTIPELVNKKICSDYLFTDGLKGFRTELNKILDPMIPISYDSKIYITPSGTVNLYEETMKCLLIEIQDNG